MDFNSRTKTRIIDKPLSELFLKCLSSYSLEFTVEVKESEILANFSTRIIVGYLMRICPNRIHIETWDQKKAHLNCTFSQYISEKNNFLNKS